MSSNLAISAPKRRACDECRSRKLACSKDPNGCSKCLREGITCIYSPQKQMGRPRKRRLVVEDEGEESANHHYPDMSAEPIPVSRPSESAAGLFDDDEMFNSSFPFSFEGGIDDIFGLEEPDLSVVDLSMDMSDSIQLYWQSKSETITTTETSNQDSPSTIINSSQPLTKTTTTAPLKPIPSISCGCLSSLYLSLDSITRLPQNDIPSSLRIARSATKIAHDVIRCPNCTSYYYYHHQDLSKPRPIQSFQNMMCLAALIPSICNAYAALLEMVDQEADAAGSEGRLLRFSFGEVCGRLFWGVTIDELFYGYTDGDRSGRGEALGFEALNERDLEPSLWRATMRAILRLDIYGPSTEDDNNNTTTTTTGTVEKRSLRDVVGLLQEQCDKRHCQLDALAAEGKMRKHENYMLDHGPYKPVPVKDRGCTKMLEPARLALEQLVIT